MALLKAWKEGRANIWGGCGGVRVSGCTFILGRTGSGQGCKEGQGGSLWLTRQRELLEDPEQGMATNVGVSERNVVPTPHATQAVSLLPEPGLRKRQGGWYPRVEGSAESALRESGLC